MGRLKVAAGTSVDSGLPRDGPNERCGLVGCIDDTWKVHVPDLLDEHSFHRSIQRCDVTVCVLGWGELPLVRADTAGCRNRRTDLGQANRDCQKSVSQHHHCLDRKPQRR